MEPMWYYVKNGTDRMGPVPESELLGLAASGEVLPGDLVWSEGMADWQPVSAVPALTGRPAPEPGYVPDAGYAPSPQPYAPSHGAPLSRIPPGLPGWMSFVGTMNIIGGVFTCLAGLVLIITIIAPLFYLPLGILLILAGTALHAGKDAIRNAASFDGQVAVFLEKVKRFMVIQGVFYIISLVMTVIFAVILAISGASMLPNLMPPR